MNNTDNAARTGEVAHTPTPYVAHKQYRSNDLLPHYWDVCTIRQDGNDTVYETVAENLSEQDAAFIVRACNSHAALVEALEAIVERRTVTKSLSCLGETPTTITAPALSHAECIRVAQAALAAALALAKGGQQ